MEYDVLGIGNAIVDVLALAEEAFIAAEVLTKGTMQLIDTARAEQLYARMNPGVEVSGGSAANTMVGVASLGGKAAFVGKVADDPLGDIFRHDMNASGVHFATAPALGELPTGRCLILVTPDAERTMNTYLGAAGLLTQSDIDPVLVRAAKVTYLEGYRFDLPETKAAFFRAANLAREAGRKVGLSLSDRFCVEGHRAEFLDLIETHVDILFANEPEINALYETDFGHARETVREKVTVACLTRGAAGSVIISGADTIEVAAGRADRVVDTTGAGDLYAAGFLYGFTRDLPLAECGRIAAIAAAEIVSHVGPRPEVVLADLI